MTDRFHDALLRAVAMQAKRERVDGLNHYVSSLDDYYEHEFPGSGRNAHQLAEMWVQDCLDVVEYDTEEAERNA